MTGVAVEVEKLLVGSMSKELLLAFREEADAAMHEAWRRAHEGGRYADTLRRAVLGHERHWNLERAMERAASRCNHEYACAATMPRGGHYGLVRLDSWLVGRAVLAHPDFPLRASKYRRTLAEMNRAASSIGSLFDHGPVVAAPQYALLLTTPDKNKPEQLARVMLGVPNTDLDGWLYLTPIQALIALFTKTEETHVTPVETIPDVAVPLLKKPRG